MISSRGVWFRSSQVKDHGCQQRCPRIALPASRGHRGSRRSFEFRLRSPSDLHPNSKPQAMGVGDRVRHGVRGRRPCLRVTQCARIARIPSALVADLHDSAASLFPLLTQKQLRADRREAPSWIIGNLAKPGLLVTRGCVTSSIKQGFLGVTTSCSSSC